MSGPDVSRLAPSEAVAALRSFPRRFRAVLAWSDGTAEPPWLGDVIAHVAAAGVELAALAGAVRRTLVEGAATAVPPPATPPDTADAALDLVTLEAGALAERVEHVGADEWERTPAALDLLREAVRATATHLRAAERGRDSDV